MDNTKPKTRLNNAISALNRWYLPQDDMARAKRMSKSLVEVRNYIEKLEKSLKKEHDRAFSMHTRLRRLGINPSGN